jgi:hypothetical protein
MNALAAAARTLEEDSAALTMRKFWHPPLDDAPAGSSSAGVTDFRRKRTAVRESGWSEPVRFITRRWPWIVPDGGDEEERPLERIYAGGERFWNFGDGWHRREAVETADPIALLERLATCDEVRPRDGAFGFLIAEGRSRFYGDAWLDEAGRIVRVTYRWWSPRRRKRPARSELWTTLELTDFGRPVAIELPEVEEAPESTFDPWGLVLDLGRVVRAAWHVFRRWRAYNARGPAPEERGSGAGRA